MNISVHEKSLTLFFIIRHIAPCARVTFDSLTSPGAKMGTWKCLRVQGFMIDPDSIGVLKEIKLGCHDGNLGELFLCA